MSYTEHRYSSQDGLSLYYRNYGAGDDVVVCLPGLTRNCKDFEDLASAPGRALARAHARPARPRPLGQ